MRKTSSVPHSAAIASLSAAAMVSLAHPAFASDGFSRFAGNWSGRGSIVMADGSREPIRCKAAYAMRPDAEAMNIDMNCGSDSYRVHVLTQLTADGTGFSGAWQETTRQAEGTVTGRLSKSGDMTADLQAIGVSIRLSARADGRRQAIRLQVQGTDVQDVVIDLQR